MLWHLSNFAEDKAIMKDLRVHDSIIFVKDLMKSGIYLEAKVSACNKKNGIYN